MRAVESFDGQRLFVARMADQTLYEVRLASGVEAPVAGFERIPVAPVTWAVARDGIYFMRRDGSGRVTIARFNLATHEVTMVCELERPSGMPGLSVSPDGRELLLSQSTILHGDIVVLENFR
jgi:hypothetical protein